MATAVGLDAELVSPRFFEDPYPTYARLQDEDPVHWCEPWGQWVVTRHDDVRRVLNDPATFSSSGWEQRFVSTLPAGARAELADLFAHYDTAVLSNSDPPAFARLRRPVVRSFVPRVLEGLRPGIEALVERLLDAIASAPRADVVSGFAYPLPAIVIGQLLGAPEEDRERFVDWSHDIVSFTGSGRADAARARRADATLREFREYLGSLVEARRREPRDDLLSLLVGAPDDERLDERELVSTCVVLLFAGHETTANLIGNGLLALLRNPDQLERLRREPELMPNAIEELLRYDSPVQRVRRVAREDADVGGKTIRAGELVMAFVGAANRDPRRFDDPHALDLERDASGHLSFGHGIHFCVGAALSRLEGPLALTGLLRRFPAARLADDAVLRWKPNITFRGLEALPLELEPRG